MTARERDTAVDALFERPPAEFIAARDSLARKLRATDGAAATRIKALRKPSAAVWAMNQLSRRHHDRVEALLAASDQLRAAHRKRSADALQSANAALHKSVVPLVDAATKILNKAGFRGGNHLERVRASLHAVPVAADEVRQQVRDGTLTADIESVDVSQLLALMDPGEHAALPEKTTRKPATRRSKTTASKRDAPRSEQPATRRSKPAASKPDEPPPRKPKTPKPAAAKPSKAASQAARRARDAARRADRSADTLAQRAVERADQLRRAAERAESAATKARAAADTAARAAEAATHRAGQAAERLAAAETTFAARRRA